MNISAISLRPYALPLRRPWTTSQGQVSSRRGYLLSIKTSSGEVGHGEVSPLPGFSIDTLGEAFVAINTVNDALLGLAVPESLSAVDTLLDGIGITAPSARYGVELALLELMAKRRGCAISKLLSASARDAVAVNASISEMDTERCVEEARRAVAEGHICIKLKVGRTSIAEDVTRLSAVREAIGDGVQLRADANGAWDLPTAREAIAALEKVNLSFIEQPTPADEIASLTSLRGDAVTPIAADESARSEADVLKLIETRAVDVVVLKPGFIGGLLRSHRMARLAHEAGIDVVVTTSLEGGVGRAGASHLAVALGSSPLACGLATGQLLTTDVCSKCLEPDAGLIEIPNKAGLGVDVLEGNLDGRWGDMSGGGLIPAPLVHRGRYFPRREALVTSIGALTYAELLKRAEACALKIQSFGIIAGDRVGLQAENCESLVVISHALARLGAVQVMLHPRWTEEETALAVRRVKCRVVIADEERLSRLRGHADTRLMPLETLASDDAVVNVNRLGLSDLVELAAPFAVLFSSGSTGTPKAIVLTHGNVTYSATGSAIRLGHLPDDRWLAVLPICHIGGLSILTRCVQLGTCVVLHETFEPSRVISSLHEGEVTLASMVTPMLKRILDAGLESTSKKFRGVLLGGGPIAPGLLARCQAIDLPVSSTYGMTEGSSQISTAPFDRDARGDGVGVPLVWSSVELRGPSAGEGEMIVEGPTVSPGMISEAGTYVKNHGALATGDLARLDGEGRLVILDRRRDRIVTGGENVLPAEVEFVLEGHSDVKEACVVGLPDLEWGHRVVALVSPVVFEGALDVASVKTHCGEALAPFKVPKSLVVVERLPRVGPGKLDRRAARALAMNLMTQNCFDGSEREGRAAAKTEQEV